MPFPVLLWILVIFASFWGYGEALRRLQNFSFPFLNFKQSAASVCLLGTVVFDKGDSRQIFKKTLPFFWKKILSVKEGEPYGFALVSKFPRCDNDGLGVTLFWK